MIILQKKLQIWWYTHIQAGYFCNFSISKVSYKSHYTVNLLICYNVYEVKL